MRGKLTSDSRISSRRIASMRPALYARETRRAGGVEHTIDASMRPALYARETCAIAPGSRPRPAPLQ